MARPKKNERAASNAGATVGYEAELWRMADALRGSMDAADGRQRPCPAQSHRGQASERLLTNRAAGG
jgi:hypothetical protein